MPHSNNTLEPDSPILFVDDQAPLPVPLFVTPESHRSSKAQIRQIIAAATDGDRSDNATATKGEHTDNG